jgi:hypothetical protein
MKCPTCGKTVKRGQLTCAFCGAMTGEPTPKVSAAGPGDFRPPASRENKPTLARDVATEEREWPSFETMEEEGLPESGEDAPHAPGPTAAQQPKPPAWVRFISPLFFVLLFLITQFWLRDSDRSSPTRSEQPVETQPSLRQGIFASEIPDGQPIERRTVFSLHDDRQIVFVSTWRGSPSGHSYSVNWYSPDAAQHPSSFASTNESAGGAEFSVICTLQLNSALPLGEWRVEVTQDEEIVSRYAFRLND